MNLYFGPTAPVGKENNWVQTAFQARGSPRIVARHGSATLSPPKVTRNRGPSIAGREDVVARLTRERDDCGKLSTPRI